MYKIIGANQVEYGPVTADQLRAWIAEGRVNAQTLIQAHGDTAWKPLSQFPEFAAALPATPPPSPLGASLAADDGRARALSLVNGPSLALIITSSVYLAWSIFNAIYVVVQGSTGHLRSLGRFNRVSASPEMEHVKIIVAIAVAAFAVFLGAFILAGAIKMRKLENYGLCMGACIAALLPCSLCCVLSLGFGIWGLVTLNNPEVKQHFR